MNIHELEHLTGRLIGDAFGGSGLVTTCLRTDTLNWLHFCIVSPHPSAVPGAHRLPLTPQRSDVLYQQTSRAFYCQAFDLWRNSLTFLHRNHLIDSLIQHILHLDALSINSLSTTSSSQSFPDSASASCKPRRVPSSVLSIRD